jgi:hypothetical protein
MKRDIFEIRGNITPTIERLEQLRIEQEEREKAEREAKYERERKEREAKAEAWKKEHWILDKYTFISQYNYETYSWPGDICNVHFYEWSDIYREPIMFSHTVGFFKFLDFSKINVTDADVNKFKANPGCHIVCKPGKNELIVGESYEVMKNKFLTEKALMSVPEKKKEEVKLTSSCPVVIPKKNEQQKVKVLSCSYFPQKCTCIP